MHKLGLGEFALLADHDHERAAPLPSPGMACIPTIPRKESISLHWFDCLGSPSEVFVGGFVERSSPSPTAGPECTHI